MSLEKEMRKYFDSVVSDLSANEVKLLTGMKNTVLEYENKQKKKSRVKVHDLFKDVFVTITDKSDSKWTCLDYNDVLRILEPILMESVVSREEIVAASDEHEQYHITGMSNTDGVPSIERAAMYCANSFIDGIDWYKKQLK